MAYIDRTEEFRLASNVHMGSAVQPRVNLPPPNFSVSNFSKVTASLSNRVSKTTLKLQRLTDRSFPNSVEFVVVRKKSLFDDKSTEINQLTGSIKSDITSINLELEELEVLIYLDIFHVEIRANTKVFLFTEPRIRSGSCGSAKRRAHGNDERFPESSGGSS